LRLLPFLLLALTTPLSAAPRPKDRAYVPADWIDRLANEPAESRPWAKLEAMVRDMPDAEWLEVGRRLSECLHRRAGRLGRTDFVTVFDAEYLAGFYGPPTRGHVAGVLCDWKWHEYSGKFDSPCPPWFWNYPDGRPPNKP
jgi:hypothetical protein